MKLSIILLAIVGVSYGFTLPEPTNRGLVQDVDDILALIPVDKITKIVTEYLANDKEVQAIAKYLKSDKFEKIVVKIAAVQEVKDFVHYLESKGLKVIELLNKLAGLLGLPTIPTTKNFVAPMTRGWRNLTDEIFELVPLDKLIATFYDKLQNSVVFAEVVQKIADSHEVFAKIAKLSEVIELADRLRELGVDVDAITDFVKSFFGWDSTNFRAYKTLESRGLVQDVDDILALIPVEKITKIVSEFLANDKEVQAIAQYLKSDKFKKIVLKIAAVKEINAFVQYLESKDLKVIELLNKLAGQLGLPTIPTTKNFDAPMTRGWRDLADEIFELVPLDTLIATFYDKLQNSAEFAEVVQKIADSHEVFSKITKFPEVIELADRLRELGVDVDSIIDFIKSFFGWD